MSKKILMNVAEGDECRIAVVEDGKLYEYFVDRPSQLKHLGNIYKGVVSNVEPGIQAAFIDLGMERNGFLHVSDTLNAYSRVENVADLYKPVTRGAEVPDMTPYPQQTPEATPQGREQGFVESAEDAHGREPAPAESAVERTTFVEQRAIAPRSETQRVEESGQEDTDGFEEAPRDDTERDSETERHREPEFLDKLTQVTPGHDVTHSPTEVIADRGTSARMPAIKQEEVAPPMPDVVPGVVNEHEALGIVHAPKPARKKRPLPDFLTHVEAPVDFKLPPPPKKKKRPGSGAYPAVSDAPQSFPDAQGNFDRDGKPSGDDGSSAPPRAFMRGPLPKIQNLLKRDQEVLVQVTKASQGGKGPGLSTFLSLPGRYMVLMPNSNKGGVSRKIEDESQRDALRRILDTLPVPDGMGVVIRTAAIGRTFDELSRDLNYLLRLWNVIVGRMQEAQAPALIYADSDPAIRAIRDYFTTDTDEIVIDDKASYERVLAFFDTIMPSFKSRVRLYEADVPLFFAEGIETQIDHIFDKKIPLKSGGYLFIEQTEALVAIDVNSGKFTSAGDAEQTAYRTNLEAIPEIVRQLRLRDLGGIICNDFIDMLAASHRSEVESTLKRELRKDRARTKIARMSPFGVMEMTRQRVRPSIRAYTYVACPTCTGSGHVRSAETLCLTLVRHMKLALSEERVKSLIVQVHPFVLSHLHSEFREDIDQLEERYDKRIIFEYARDLVLGDARIFYVNDRDLRVLYDLDQKINQYVREAEFQSKVNVALPVASLGVAGQPEPEVKFSDRRGRRGGRKQRDRDGDRQAKAIRTQVENAKAVPSFGAEMPELPTAPAGAVPASVDPAQQRHQERRDRSRERGRERRPFVPAAPQNGVVPGTPEPVAASAPLEANGQPAAPGVPGQPGAPGEVRRRRGRRGGRRRREREERRRGQPGQPGIAGQSQGAQPAIEGQRPVEALPVNANAQVGSAPQGDSQPQVSGQPQAGGQPGSERPRGRRGRRGGRGRGRDRTHQQGGQPQQQSQPQTPNQQQPQPQAPVAPVQAAPQPAPVVQAPPQPAAHPAAVEAAPKRATTRKVKPDSTAAAPKKRASVKKAPAKAPAKKAAAKKPAAKKPVAKKKK